MANAKRGLGKGLNVLIPDSLSEVGVGGEVTELPLRLIKPNPNQPRSSFDEESIDELAVSIKINGLIQPIVVRPLKDKYQIIAGERRWQACKKLKMESVPVRVMDADDVKTLQLALVENLQRTNLNPIEVATGYQELINATGMTHAELASAVSKSRTDVTNTLRLLILPDEVKELVSDGSVSAGHARAIASVSDDAKKVELAKRITEGKLSVRETERLARLFSADKPPVSQRQASPRSFKLVARKLRQYLDAPVRVRTTRGRNRIDIEFKDEDDLQRIFSLLSGNNQGVR